MRPGSTSTHSCPISSVHYSKSYARSRIDELKHLNVALGHVEIVQPVHACFKALDGDLAVVRHGDALQAAVDVLLRMLELSDLQLERGIVLDRRMAGVVQVL